ncbi:MAG: pyruvate kinase [Bdellovibrionaceae bacterium]|nr:pyruvate kinase [Pseudobdellovibrionaceae bacterium]|tara:strand:- start:77356 stop:78825 length:1470 start_codon:yes stop_codon:yes gene_type:complete
MLADRRAKIVATIGPATQSKENLKKCIESGMNVARLNFSHGKHEDHIKVIQSIRELTDELKAPVAILQDLQGPKIRVGQFDEGSKELVEGDKVIIRADKAVSDGSFIPTDFKELPQSCNEGTRILLDDGLLELVVDQVIGAEVHCTVVFGGILKNRKGMNLPEAILPVECMTPKDLDDLEFGLSQKVDYVALSFVRRGSDIRKLRELIELKHPSTRIVAKIEMLEAIDNLKEIVKLSDGVMVARGDLAVEVGQTRLPQLQKEIINLCNELGKPVITATQMLDSMVENPRPTRAEITDVANAVLDGSDACMLSAESASGKYPFKCIQTMGDIIQEVERDSDFYYDIRVDQEILTIADSIAETACLAAMKLNASAIVCLTTSGRTASLISSYRPKAKVIAVTHLKETLNRLELVWGIQTLNIKPYKSTDEAMSQIQKLLLEYGLIHQGDKVVLTLGTPVMEQAKTNSLRVYTITQKVGDGADAGQRPLRVR